jgi:hypothetical protein
MAKGFIMKSVFVKVLFSLTMWLIPLAVAQAQQNTTAYVVSSTVGARARACPALDCDEMFRFDQNDELSVLAIVTGNTVSGSDEWLEVSTEAGVVYVHSSLARPVAGAAPHTTVSDAEAEPALETVSTNGWNFHEAGALTFRAPRGLNDAVEFYSDEEFLEDLATMNGEDPDEFIANMNSMFQDESFDAFLMDTNSGASIFVTHEDLDGMSITLNLIERVLTRHERDAGSNILDSENLTLPVGGVVRLHLIRTSDDRDSKWRAEVVIYAIPIGDLVYYVEIALEPSLYEDYLPTINTIATTFGTQ